MSSYNDLVILTKEELDALKSGSGVNISLKEVTLASGHSGHTVSPALSISLSSGALENQKSLSNLFASVRSEGKEELA
jgi:hypothetical protein